jgi:formylmethanofuran dehydrogenase subunit E
MKPTLSGALSAKQRRTNHWKTNILFFDNQGMFSLEVINFEILKHVHIVTYIGCNKCSIGMRNYRSRLIFTCVAEGGSRSRNRFLRPSVRSSKSVLT